MMSVDEKAREMARQYIPHEGGFSMGGLLQNIIEYFEADVAQLRADRNAAQQRAEQAERERDEAREYLRRITAIVDGWARVPSTMPDAWDTICGVLNERDLMTAPQAQPAPTVKAGDGRYSVLSHITITPKADTLTVKASDGELTELLDKARDEWDAASDVEMRFYKRTNYLHAAVGDILDIVERLVKGGAS